MPKNKEKMDSQFIVWFKNKIKSEILRKKLWNFRRDYQQSKILRKLLDFHKMCKIMNCGHLEQISRSKLMMHNH